jgi:hypothetical protein
MTTWTGEDMLALRRALTAKVLSVPNPANWLLALRQACEALGIPPELGVPLAARNLADACYDIIQAAAGRGESPADVRRALDAWTPLVD